MTDDALKEHLFRYIASQGQDFSLPSGGITARMLSEHAVISGLPPQYLHAKHAGLLDRLKKVVSSPDEGFSDMLLRKIREAGMTNAECYHRAGIDRQLFSRILSDRHYRPGKRMVFALVMALKMDEEESRELIARAGYAFSRSDKFDLAIEFFIRAGFYDVMKINEYLHMLDLPRWAPNPSRKLSSRS